MKFAERLKRATHFLRVMRILHARIRRRAVLISSMFCLKMRRLPAALKMADIIRINPKGRATPIWGRP